MKKHPFPKGFLWGVSTAAHQVEGNNVNSDWWSWEQKEPDRPKSGVACDHYHLFKEDFALAKKMGHNSHRLSIEWARIEPRQGRFDEKEVEHYRDVLKELRKLKLKSFVTLWHFTLPKWFADLGGFERESNIKYFSRYVRFCAENFGDLVDYFLTINEPNNYVLKSYFAGYWPPQKKNPVLAMRVYKNICKAHNVVYQTIKKVDRKYKVGAAHQLIKFYSTGGLINGMLTRLSKYLANDFFYNNTFNNFDFIGLNYYFTNPVSYKYLLKIGEMGSERILRDESKDLGWGMDPEGIYDCIKYIQAKFDKPIYILEHGISDPDDKKRSKYIKKALESVAKAIKEGADIRSYLHWTLMDNFEWSFGYTSKFGMFALEPKTLKRLPRKSAFVFSKIARENAI